MPTARILVARAGGLRVSATTLATLFAVACYVVATIPFLPLMLVVHRLGGAYAGLFLAALVMQILPIGLVFIPVGALGVALLAYTLRQVSRRLVQFRLSGMHNADVHARWVKEWLANWVAFGLALEQKAAAWLFLEASSGHPITTLTLVFGGLSAGLWAFIAWKIGPEWRRLRELQATPVT